MIELAKERRTALISVTGKIDVRDWVAEQNHDSSEVAA